MKFGTIVFILSLSLIKLQAQSEKIETVETEEYMMPLKWQTEKKPVFYNLSYPLAEKEIWQLDTLSNNERQLIKNTVDPIAIGIVRSLKAPVSFDLKNIPIPLHGEVFFAGGRLARINNDTIVFTTAFRSKKASEIRLYFENGFLPFGVQVNFFGKDDYAFTQQGLSGKIDKDGFYQLPHFRIMLLCK